MLVRCWILLMSLMFKAVTLKFRVVFAEEVSLNNMTFRWIKVVSLMVKGATL